MHQSVLVVLLVLIASSTAHICILSPLQRAPLFDLNTEGSNACKWFSGPCGVNTPGKPAIGVTGGNNLTVVFQKNENHWTLQNRGNFTVNFAVNTNDHFHQLALVEDTNTSSLTLFTVNVTIPITPLYDTHAVLQMIYYTDGGPPNFFQCADIIVYAKGPGCGDGIVQAGEQCDPPSKAACCNNLCQFYSVGEVCGNHHTKCQFPSRCGLANANVPSSRMVCKAARNKEVRAVCSTFPVAKKCNAQGKCA